ncbi:MAG TPA: hypothetical protein VKH81_14900 [Candidatus Angelobacter sp.]|nr:hypothetical protein [Candidatus Angelobacter sp.]
MAHAYGQKSAALEISDFLFQPGRAKIIGPKADRAAIHHQFCQASGMGNHGNNSRNSYRTGGSQQLIFKLRARALEANA